MLISTDHWINVYEFLSNSTKFYCIDREPDYYFYIKGTIGPVAYMNSYTNSIKFWKGHYLDSVISFENWASWLPEDAREELLYHLDLFV